ncbi:MAG TPA: amidohydrolase family protein [Xanthomonadaceae bacterium]|nr:amidohydrolase family protein [Xanthomonadaceae bacterium]
MRLTALFPIVLVLASAAAPAQTVAFRDVTVIPMDSERRLESHTVIVREDTIAELGPSDLVPIPRGARVIEGEGRFLMPGLAEMHAHVPPLARSQDVERALDLFLVNGVTTLRGVLGEPGHLSLRAQLASGRRNGPRLYTSGPSFNGNSVTGAGQAIEMVGRQKRDGYDLLKLHPGLEADEFDAIVSRARAVGIPVTGHVPDSVPLEHALAAGLGCIEHMDGYVRALLPPEDPARSRDPGFFGLDVVAQAQRERIHALVEATRKAGAAVTPTETLMVNLLGGIAMEELLQRDEMAYVPAPTLAQWKRSRESMQARTDAADASRFLQLRRELLLALHRGGVPVLLGSDAPQVFNVPGFSTHRELALMVEAGLSPYEALRTGTVASAEHLGVGDRRGKVAAGHEADLVLLEADPLTDIGHARRIVGVMVAGRWHARSDLDARLARIRGEVAASDGP